MKAHRTALVPFLALLAMQALGQAPETGTAGAHRYELPNRDGLELAVPPAWEDSVDQPEDGGSPIILLHPREGAPFEIYITPAWHDAPAGALPDMETLRETVRTAAERLRGQTVEDTLEIRRLQGASGVGFYFVATDRAPQPEEFRFMHQGALQVGALTVTFTILTNEGQEAVVEQALAMLRSAAHLDTGRDQQ